MSQGHQYDLPDLPYWEESMPIPYSHQNLGESSYTPIAGDLMAPRYVRQEEFYTPAYGTAPVAESTNYGGQPLAHQTRPDG